MFMKVYCGECCFILMNRPWAAFFNPSDFNKEVEGAFIKEDAYTVKFIERTPRNI